MTPSTSAVAVCCSKASSASDRKSAVSAARPACAANSCNRAIWWRFKGRAEPTQLFHAAILMDHGCDVEAFPVVDQQVAMSRAAQPQRLSQHGMEHGVEVAGRGVDDLQDLGGRGLLRQGLVPLGGAKRQLAPKVGDYLRGIARDIVRH